jgi:chloride channel protein, CIC family
MSLFIFPNFGFSISNPKNIALSFEQLLVKFLVWRMKHISNRNWMLVLAGAIGLLSGLAGVLLKESVHFIQKLLTKGFDVRFENYFYLAYPLVGILLAMWVSKYFFGERSGHGITQVLYAISKRSGILKRSMMYSRMLTSALTVGFGGSVGLEGPIVVTGSAIGSNIARLMHMTYKKRTLLIGCGAAGAIASIFNSPIAGVIFCLEVILVDITIASFIPLLIASVTGALVSLTLLGEDVLFSFRKVEDYGAGDMPFFLLLGIACGLVSVYFTRVTYRVEGLIQQVKSDFGRVWVGGILLGLIIFVFPPIYGEGYETIKLLLQGRSSEILNNSFFFGDRVMVLVLFTIAVVLIKPVASALTIGSGGTGGVFAPSLFIGGLTGFVFAESSNYFFGTGLSTSNFTLVGMCGVMSGVLHAPLTAIFLIAEVTSGYQLFVPLMLVSAIGYNAATFFEKHSLYTKHLVESGDLIPHDKDKQVLSQITLEKIIEKDLLTIHPDASLATLTDLVRVSKRNIFPVVNDTHELEGIITLDDIREIMFDEDARRLTQVKSLMMQPPAFVSPHENMQSVMLKFEQTGAWNLPVIDKGLYVGFVSKSRIFNSYRKKLMHQSRE